MRDPLDEAVGPAASGGPLPCSAHAPRSRATKRAAEATIAKVGEVLSEGGLIRRMRAKVDGPNEGAFLPCSCWMADCLALQGRHEEAVAQFERLLAVGNDLGLFAEGYNVPAKHLTGNFLQALTHLAIVNTGLSLSGPVLSRGALGRASTTTPP